VFQALRRFAHRPAAALPCDLCGQALASPHEHVIDPARRDLRCTCARCAVLMSTRAGTRWQRVPWVLEPLGGPGLTDAQWDSLAIPVNVAFFYRSAAHDEMRAVYPSPAGGTESVLTGSAWESLFAEHPALNALAPDVEAFLVSRLGGAREHYRVSIDVGYALIGVIRRHWRGFSGGAEVWDAIDHFFETLRGGSRRVHA